jgi:hypothetical protein
MKTEEYITRVMYTEPQDDFQHLNESSGFMVYLFKEIPFKDFKGNKTFFLLTIQSTEPQVKPFENRIFLCKVDQAIKRFRMFKGSLVNFLICC